MNNMKDQLLEYSKTILKNRWFTMVAILFLGIIMGNLIFSTDTPSARAEHASHVGETTWTCSMHPQIKLDESGQCPICFMDLIPVENTHAADQPNEYTLSASAARLAKVATSPARRGLATSELHLSGRIDYDETKVKSIAAWFPGRLDRLFVDYTGIQVTEGDHLFEIYSPELYSAQEELLLAHRRWMNKATTSSGQAEAAFQTAKVKTELLGLNAGQIKAILNHGKARSSLQINSPITGIVTHKNAIEGKYVKTGEAIYTIADLSQVWLTLEAYEKDLPWLTYGQTLSFEVPGLPGETFTAQVSYIDPLVDSQTRSTRVRAVLDNVHGKLKPGMLAQAIISVEFDGHGKVNRPDLSGMWVCPMHPEVLEPKAGSCSVCGMDLVPVQADQAIQLAGGQALLIPVSAVLKTGKRALVYVEIAGGDNLTYEQREIVLGPRAGDDQVVLSGLSEGEKVVTKGNFKIDSAMQIAGKSSMMNLPVSPKKEVAVSANFTKTLTAIYDQYLSLQANLAADQPQTAQNALLELMKQVEGLDVPPHHVSALLAKFKPSSGTPSGSIDMAELRVKFEQVSIFVRELQNTYGHHSQTMLYEVYCPMAFDNQGAYWLQADQQVKNPYFGASMLSCGEVTQRFAPEER